MNSASKLLVFHSEKKFLLALRTLSERKVSPIEALSAYDLKEDPIFQGPETSLQIVKFAALAGAVIGLLSGFLLAWYPSALDAPLNIGGRPLNSWPAWVPLIFVLGVLFAALSAFLAFFWRLNFPLPYHPVFESPSYQLHRDQFYILAPSDLHPSLLESLNPDKTEEIH